MLVLIAWRNIWRSRFRSLVIICSVALGLWAGVFIIAFSWGINQQRLVTAIEGEVSHVQIHHPEFKKERELQYTIPGGLQRLARLQSDPRLRGVSGRALAKGMVSSASHTGGVQITGIEAGDENRVTQLKKRMVQGDYLDSSSIRHPILMGQKLAEKMKVKLRSKVVLTFQDSSGNIVAGAFRLAGIFRSTNTAFDERTVFVKREDLNQLAGMDNSIHEIALLLKDPEQLELFRQQTQQANPGLLVESWKELSPDLELILATFDQGMAVFLSIIMLGLAFGIVNTMLMAVLERVRELGMLMAIGMNKVRLFLMIMLETVFLSLAGCPVGLLLGFLTVLYLRHTGIDLSAFGQGLNNWGMDSMVYPEIAGHYYVQMSLLVFVTAVISAIFPAVKALRLRPADAVRSL